VRILGVDPGLRLTGFGCLDIDPARPTDAPTLVDAGCVKLPLKRSVAFRLDLLERELSAVVAELRPTAAAVEALFAHYAHPRTAITMAHARGVILLVLERAGLEPLELPPNEVKKATTGHGQASKRQMQLSVQTLLSLPEPPEPADVADALAIAAAGAQRILLAEAAAR
jgi:crossover junction endodeoxyribonuclease RuvC